MTLVIDCHGHYAVLPKAHDQWRGQQVAAFCAGEPEPPYPEIGDDDIRETIEADRLRLIRERGANFTIFSPRASAMAPAYRGRERRARMGVTSGPALEMPIAPLRSYVFETMRHRRLFLAGDSVHIMPPTGAKGQNLAASDVAYLADALSDCLRKDDEAGLAAYQGRDLARVWKAECFSWYLTKLMHVIPEDGAFKHRMQRAEFDYLASSEAMQRAVAENYVGLPS